MNRVSRNIYLPLTALSTLFIVSCQGSSSADDDEDCTCPGSGADPEAEKQSAEAAKEWVDVTAGGFWMGSPDGICPEDYTGGAACVNEIGRGDYDEGDELENETLHYVELTNSFEVMATEVTQDQFKNLMGHNPSYFNVTDSGIACGAFYPVENVSLYDALAYANELSKDKNLRPCYTFSELCCAGEKREGEHLDRYDGGVDEYPVCVGGSDYMACFEESREEKGIIGAVVKLNEVTTVYNCQGYRLPTEAEWEFSARASTISSFYNGEISDEEEDPVLDEVAWYYYNSKTAFTNSVMPHPVARKEPNPWGLYDTLGNVSEWVWEYYEAEYPESDTQDPLVNPESRDFIDLSIEGDEDDYDKQNLVSRGGGYGNSALSCRAAARSNRWFLSGGGFRLVRTTDN